MPEPVREGLEVALRKAVNVTNRKNKRAKFGFTTSEDAVTWTVFCYLQTTHNLSHFVDVAQHVVSADISPRLLLWGVEMTVPAHGLPSIERRLETISRKLGESSNRRTEPDAIIEVADAGVIVIEAKLRSDNDRLRYDHAHWQRYIDKGFSNAVAVRETGLYELTRNWRFAHELAAGRPFTLVNLGFPTLFEDPRLEQWGHALDNSVKGRFVRVSWQQVLKGMTLESWMLEFCRQRGLLED